MVSVDPNRDPQKIRSCLAILPAAPDTNDKEDVPISYLPPSTVAQNFMGTHIPLNTEKSSKSGLALHAQFVMKIVSNPSEGDKYKAMASSITASDIKL